jgi:hypothetical protein
MKKFSIISVFVIAALIAGCASSGGASAGTGGTPQGEPTVVLVKLDTSFIKDGKPLDKDDIAMGRGWIVGEQFQQIMNAKPGSFIRLTVTGTKNLNWDTIGAVGIKKVEDQGMRIDFKPKGGGTYTVDIPIDDLKKKLKREKEAIGVNIWGEHVIDKIEIYLY